MQLGRLSTVFFRIAHRSIAVLLIAFLTNASLAQRNREDDGVVTESKVSRIWCVPSATTNQARWNPRDLMIIDAMVVDHTSERLLYAKLGETKVIEQKGDWVVAIDVAWETPEAKLANQLYQKGEYRQAISETTNLRGANLLPWQQRALLANSIDSLRALGMMDRAGQEFLRLAKLNPPSLLYFSMPLLWTNDNLDRKSIQSAQEWMKEDDEHAKLLGASWLLSGNQRSDAISALESLSNSSNPIIRQLAATQLWRSIPAAEVSSRLSPKWSAARDSMPIPIQWGPTIVLADKLEQSGNPILAVPEWLRIASLYPDRYDASKQAIEKAKTALIKVGRAEEASKIQSHFSSDSGRIP